ncbi:MAG: rhodanese-like domain-containing protein [Nonlabens sp.]|nr:rhodanese-like domain-containing protein [Nonlabens sp.]
MSFFNSLFGTKSQDSKTITVLDATAFKEAITANKVMLLDVRTAQEFKEGHIKGAKNLDYFNTSTFKSTVEKLDRSKPVYLYCRSGNRSNNAAKLMENMGFTELIDLKNGYVGWPFKK